MNGAVQALADGRGGMVIIDGPAGMGKSLLISHAQARAAALGVSVASGRADEDQLVPLAPLLAAFRAWVGAPTAGAIDTRLWLLEQLSTELEERVSHQPLLVALDDLQWTDPATVLAVQSLVPQLASYPVLWLLAGEAGPTLDHLCELFAGQPQAVRIRLRPLSLEAWAQLFGDVVGGAPDEELLALGRGAEGNPLLVVDLAEGLRDDGAIAVADGQAHPVPAQLTGPLPAGVDRRLSRLSPDARDLLEVAAVLGRSFWLDDVAEVLGQPVGRLLRPVHEALDAGVLVAAGDVLAFHHEVVRHAAYLGMAEPVRQALHRHIGGLLLDRDGSALPAAPHLAHAARPGDRQAASGLDRAVRELLASSPQAAADLAVRALELTEASEQADGDRFARAVAAVDALVAAPRLAGASEIAASVLAHPRAPAAVRARLRLTLSSIRTMTGEPGAAVADADAVLAEPGLPDSLYTAAELARLLALLAQADHARARQAAEEIVAGADRPGGDGALAGALAALGFIAWKEGQVANAIGLVRAAVQRADLSPPEARNNYPRFGLAFMLRATGGFDEATALIGTARREIELGRDTLRAAGPSVSLSRIHLAAGRLDDAAAEAETALATSKEQGTRFFGALARLVLASVALLRGDLHEARQHVDGARADAPPAGAGDLFSADHTWMEARLADAEGGPARAWTVLAGVYDEPGDYKNLFVEEPAAGAWLARTALATGNTGRAHAVVACVEQLAADNTDIPSVRAAAAHARGVLDRDPAALERAATDHPHPWAQASAHEDGGVVLPRSGARKGARNRLERALATYEELGADRDAARVRARLRDLGGRRGQAARAERPVAGWASLTATQRKVATLVAEGLTNPQVAGRMFLSRHTVDFHLRQIFRKLAIGSRVELTRLSLAHDAAAP